MPETAFLGAQIAPKSLSAGASPQTPLGELSSIQGALLLRGGDGRGRGGPRKIVHPVKFLRIGSVSNGIFLRHTVLSWTLKKNEETRLDAFETKRLRKILRVSWIAKKTNEWVLNKAGVKRELLDTVKEGS